jgi:predicted Zn finger-like uncharacterized protein
MIVQCPKCQAKFKLPDDKVGAAGVKLRCGKCRHVFHVDPPAPPETGGLTDFDFPDDMAPTPASPASPYSAASTLAAPDDVPPDLFHSQSYEKTAGKEPDGFDDQDGLEDQDDQSDQSSGPVKPGFSLDDVADIPLPGSSSSMSKERRRRILIIAGVIVVVLAATLAAVHFLDLWPGKKAAKDASPSTTATAPATPGTADKPSAPETPTAQKPEETAKVKDIMLQNVRQYYVSNEKAGQLFVIEGKAVNNFKTPKEMIKLEASLFDEKGGALATQNDLAGNTVSLFQLQVMTRDELKNALASQVGVLTNNTNIGPGGEVPFMVVFFDPPEAVKEFGVKVVDVKDPPRQ